MIAVLVQAALQILAELQQRGDLLLRLLGARDGIVVHLLQLSDLLLLSW